MTFTNKGMGRLAGCTYLIVVLTGIFSLIYVPSQLISLSDPEATLANIAASETLFRLGVAAGFVCYVAFLVLPFLLYVVLAPYGRVSAALMAGLAAVSVPLSFLAVSEQLAVAQLIGDDGAAADAGVMMAHFEAYNLKLSVATIFWGLWLLPFGYLVMKSGAIPRILGVFLALGCFGYLTGFFGPLFFPAYGDTIIADIAGIPASVGEIGACLWLLIMGARNHTDA